MGADIGKYKGLRLSPQQVISCDKKSQGCNGGGVDSVWGYIQRRGLYPERRGLRKPERSARRRRQLPGMQLISLIWIQTTSTMTLRTWMQTSLQQTQLMARIKMICRTCGASPHRYQLASILCGFLLL